MGCCISRTPGNSDCENLLQNAEASLKIHFLKSKDIDRVVHRYSSNFHTSDSQFEIAFKDLKFEMENPNIVDFFKMFYLREHYAYCVRKITCLGVLLGSGEFIEKVHLLFQNYDVDSSNSLGKEEVKLMISDIISIVFQYLLTYAMCMFDSAQSNDLEEYKKSLINIKGTISNYFLNLIFEGQDQEISLENFVRQFTQTECKFLITTSQLRIYSIEIQKVVSKTAVVVQDCIDHPENLNTNTLIDRGRFEKQSSLHNKYLERTKSTRKSIRKLHSEYPVRRPSSEDNKVLDFKNEVSELPIESEAKIPSNLNKKILRHSKKSARHTAPAPISPKIILKRPPNQNKSTKNEKNLKNDLN